MIPVEWMPPLMFGGLVIFMLIGYSVSFSLAAVAMTRSCCATPIAPLPTRIGWRRSANSRQL